MPAGCLVPKKRRKLSRTCISTATACKYDLPPCEASSVAGLSKPKAYTSITGLIWPTVAEVIQDLQAFSVPKLKPSKKNAKAGKKSNKMSRKRACKPGNIRRSGSEGCYTTQACPKLDPVHASS